ncbi:hypothetical protein Vadar_018920 [Vaccinium darrowii]|uniref:Uncharacterized protein n=1 Tax=Vaccinium darrowii TaxID=229202 RepID=A0ACB7ZCQ9_9ERIC|nr:hypothetical protein Vadar_018920 [Vaccinium darrowii]
METFAQDLLAINIFSGVDSSHESHFQGASSHNLVGETEASFADGGGIQLEGSGRRFSLDEVLKATLNFHHALIIGTGGFGKVYKGYIHDGAATTILTIKRLNAESKQGAEEFWTEVTLLSKLRHTHLVSLIGYCNEGHEMILVYEYIASGTLANHLYKTSGGKSVLCGRPPVDNRLKKEQVSLILWAKMYIKKGNLDEIIDSSLKRETTLRNLKYFAKLANKCLHDQPKERPTMAKVVESLEIALVSHEHKGRSQGTIAKAFQDINLVPKGMGRWWRDGGESSKHSSLKPLSDDLTLGTAESHISPSGYRSFSLEEIHAATNGFDQGLLISLDASFRLYKGCMLGGTLVVVKRYQPIELTQFVKEVLDAEIQVPSLTPHPNVVSLIGFCYEKQESILVYEYMANGTLSSHLLGTDDNLLPWQKRLEICIDIARGLKHLQTNVEQEVIDRSIKPSNIYLDDRWVAKVAAFELSKPNPTRKWHGTMRTKKLYVYSLGAVLVDVLCAKKPHNLDEDLLVPWFCVCLRRGTIDDFIGPYLMGKIAPECFRQYVNIALSCLVRRPSMDVVLGRLQSTLQLQAAWENSIEVGDELHVANVPGSYKMGFLDGEFRIGEHRICDLVPYWPDGIPYGSDTVKNLISDFC